MATMNSAMRMTWLPGSSVARVHVCPRFALTLPPGERRAATRYTATLRSALTDGVAKY